MSNDPGFTVEIIVRDPMGEVITALDNGGGFDEYEDAIAQASSIYDHLNDTGAW